MSQQRCKVFTISASTGFVVKDTLERITSSNIKEARAIITMLDVLDEAFCGFSKLEETRDASINGIVAANKAVAEGKATAEQNAESKLSRTRWWKELYAKIDGQFTAKELVLPNQAADMVAGLLEKQTYDSTGMRHVVLFVDAVAAAVSEMREIAGKEED